MDIFANFHGQRTKWIVILVIRNIISSVHGGHLEKRVAILDFYVANALFWTSLQTLMSIYAKFYACMSKWTILMYIWLNLLHYIE